MDVTTQERQAERTAHPAKAKYYTKAGRLTWFALTCGYQETKYDGALRLHCLPGTVLVAVEGQVGELSVYKEFESLVEARSFFDAQV